MGLAFVVLLFQTNCARKGPPAEVVHDKRLSPYHLVQRGENISSIAQRYGMSRKAIIRINGLQPPYKLVIGQRLIIVPNVEDDEIKKGEMSLIKTTDDVEIMDHPDQQPLLDQEKPDSAEAVTPKESSAQKSASLYPETSASKDKILTKKASASGYSWPVEGMVIQGFSKKNPGINIRAPKGTQVAAARDGLIVHAGVVKGFGNTILIKHNETFMSVYAHLQRIIGKNQARVKRGQVIGTVGNTGKQTKDAPPTLHFEIRCNTKPVDPRKYLPKD
jgi:lipoprotein NlpD